MDTPPQARLTRTARYAACMSQSLSAAGPDVQAQTPSLRVSLSRVGVTEIEKIVRIRQNGQEQLFSARLQCFVDLGAQQKGAHMSRFEEVVNEVIGEVVLGESTFKAEALATRVAELVRERQGARRAEGTVAAGPRGPPGCPPPPATPSKSRRPSRGSRRRRSTRSTESPWRRPRAPA